MTLNTVDSRRIMSTVRKRSVLRQGEVISGGIRQARIGKTFFAQDAAVAVPASLPLFIRLITRDGFCVVDAKSITPLNCLSLG